MTFSIFHVLALILFIFAGSYFLAALRVRELALVAARQHCRQLGLQLLDQTVGMNRIWLKRDEQQKIRVWRAFHFEFASTGDERYKGRIVTLGKLVESIELQPYRVES